MATDGGGISLICGYCFRLESGSAFGPLLPFNKGADAAMQNPKAVIRARCSKKRQLEGRYADLADLRSRSIRSLRRVESGDWLSVRNTAPANTEADVPDFNQTD